MKNPYNFFPNNKISFLINLVFLLSAFFTASCQTKKITEKEHETRDSLGEVLESKNREKIEKSGKYIFSDTINLYQYKPAKISLETLNGTSSRQDKIDAIRKVKKYKNKKKLLNSQYKILLFTYKVFILMLKT